MPSDELDISLLKKMFDTSLQGVFVVHNRKIIYVNDTLCESIGFEIEDCQGDRLQTLTAILAPGFTEEAVESYRKMASGETESSHGRHEFIGTDGQKRFLDTISNRVTIGNEEYIIVFSVDATADQILKETLATERKVYSIIAEAALSNEEIDQLCDRILSGLVSTLGFDLGTIRLYDETDQMLYLKASVGIEEGVTPKAVHKDDPDFLVARTARTLSPLFTSDIEQSPESQDRMARARELKVRSLIFWPIVGTEHDLLGVINIAAHEAKDLGPEDRTVFATIAGMFSTILERRYTEQELQDSQDRFVAFADNMPGPVYIKDDQSKVLFINRYMRDISRMPAREDWEGKSNIDLWRSDRAKELTEEDQRVLREGPIERAQETIQDGKVRTFRTHKFPIFREGKPPLIGGFSLDITEQIEAQKQREEARARAEFFNDLMAHDLNNMHQGIMSSLELILADKGLSDQQRKMAENALRQVNRSVSLINNVKKFSMVNQENLVLEKTDPGEALITAIQIVNQTFPDRKLVIETNLSIGTYCIMANEFLEDVFYNLLHNAVKFTESEEVRLKVTSSLTEEGEFLKIDFEDWGTGIEDRLKESILSGIDERVLRVSGVGLTLVKQIVDQYNGSIVIEDRVEGEHTQGAKVVVLLPNGC
ncbi:MAG: PAS domain S-box protein [Candidatus Thorarchaeota archaeon]